MGRLFLLEARLTRWPRALSALPFYATRNVVRSLVLLTAVSGLLFDKLLLEHASGVQSACEFVVPRGMRYATVNDLHGE